MIGEDEEKNWVVGNASVMAARTDLGSLMVGSDDGGVCPALLLLCCDGRYQKVNE
jgi:hypothetical protein